MRELHIHKLVHFQIRDQFLYNKKSIYDVPGFCGKVRTCRTEKGKSERIRPLKKKRMYYFYKTFELFLAGVWGSPETGMEGFEVGSKILQTTFHFA